MLKPVSCQAIGAGGADVPGPDLERTHVTVYSVIAAEEVLNRADFERANEGATQLVLGAIGSMFLNFFFDDIRHSGFLADFETALATQQLLVGLTVGPEFGPADRAFLDKWLAGGRAAEDITMWTNSVGEIGLVRLRT